MTESKIRHNIKTSEEAEKDRVKIYLDNEEESEVI